MMLLTSTCLVGCSNWAKYLYIEEAKELAAQELDALEPNDYTDYDLLDTGLENKVYRVGGSDNEVAYLDILLDAVTGDVVKSESESLYCGKYPWFGENQSFFIA